MGLPTVRTQFTSPSLPQLSRLAGDGDRIRRIRHIALLNELVRANGVTGAARHGYQEQTAQGENSISGGQ